MLWILGVTKGDTPDPTPGRNQNGDCEEVEPTHAYACTLPLHHEGIAHMAGDGERLVSIWTTEEEEER